MSRKQALLIPTKGGASYISKVIATSPLAYWPLKETSGTVAADVVGGFNGTYKRNVSTMGVEAGPSPGTTAPTFDGTNDVINIYSVAYSNAFPRAAGSLVMWGKAYHTDYWAAAVVAALFCSMVSGNGIKVWKSSGPANRLYILDYFGAGVNDACYHTVNVATAGWFMFAGTWDYAADAVHGYWNDANSTIHDGSSLGEMTGALNAGLCVIGAAASTPTTPWRGSVSDVILYNRALTPTEITNIYTWGLQ